MPVAGIRPIAVSSKNKIVCKGRNIGTYVESLQHGIDGNIKSGDNKFFVADITGAIISKADSFCLPHNGDIRQIYFSFIAIKIQPIAVITQQINKMIGKPRFLITK